MGKTTLADLYEGHGTEPVFGMGHDDSPDYVDRQDRTETYAPANIVGSNSVSLNGYLINRSKEGARLRLDRDGGIHVGDQVYVSISQENLRARAVVIWREAGGIGVAFVRD